MLKVCQRHFCAITKGTMPKVVELEYFEEAPTKLLTTIIRNPQMTIATYGNRSIYLSLVKVQSDEEEKTTEEKETKWKVNRKSKMPLLKWYLDHQLRLEKDRVDIYPTAEEAAMNPRDLNIYCALPFDIPFEKAHPNPENERAAFADPSPGEAVDWEAWRRLEGLDLLLWTLKYVICDGDETSFAYLMQWSAFIFQKRRKPCVLVLVHGPPGSVKSAIFGSNQTGAGPYMRIYGTQAYKLNDMQSLTQKHNTAVNGKFYCTLEEATPYRKAHLASDKLKDILDSSTQRIEPKGVDDFEVKDHRAFVSLTNNMDAFPGEQGDRRKLALDVNPHFSKLSVDNGQIEPTVRDEFCAKFDRLKNSDEVAYNFFEYCMLLDLSDFKLNLPPRTKMLKEMQEHTKCALECFLEAVASREHGCNKYPYDAGYDASYAPAITEEQHAEKEEVRIRNKWTDLNATDLYGKFKEWKWKTDAETSIESSASFGIALKKYTIGDKTCTTKPLVSKKNGRSRSKLYTINLLGEEDDIDGGDEEEGATATAAGAGAATAAGAGAAAAAGHGPGLGGTEERIATENAVAASTIEARIETGASV